MPTASIFPAAFNAHEYPNCSLSEPSIVFIICQSEFVY